MTIVTQVSELLVAAMLVPLAAAVLLMVAATVAAIRHGRRS